MRTMTELIAVVEVGHNAFATMPEHFEWIVKQNVQKQADELGRVLTSVSCGAINNFHTTDEGSVYEVVEVWAKGIIND